MAACYMVDLQDRIDNTFTHEEVFMAARAKFNNVLIKDKQTPADRADFKTKIEILLKLAVIPDIEIFSPRVSVKNDAVTLGGIVDAFWKRAYIGYILESELPGRHVTNNLTVAMNCSDENACQESREKEPGTIRGPGMPVMSAAVDRSM
jgi:hypothetical protein